MIIGQFALFDAREQANGADGVFVHRIVVVHVELHLGVDPGEFGNEPAKHPRFIQPAQHRFGIMAAGQQIEKQRVGAWIAAHAGIDQLGVAGDEADGVGVDFIAFAIGQHIDFQQTHRVGNEPVVAGCGDAAG